MKALLMSAAVLFSTVSFADVCFNSSFVQNWTYDNSTEILKVKSFSDEYSIKTRFCNELPWAQSIAFKSVGGSSFVCSGDDIIVMDAWNKPVQSCHIWSITKSH